MGKTLLRNARAIVSCDERDRVYEHCDLLIEGQEVLEIAPHISWSIRTTTFSRPLSAT